MGGEENSVRRAECGATYCVSAAEGGIDGEDGAAYCVSASEGGRINGGAGRDG